MNPTDTQHAFREAMASVCTPVSVVTGLAEGRLHGTTVSAFASLSMDPPMVLVCLDHASELLGVIRESGRFGLNVLTGAQTSHALAFARKGGTEKASGTPWDIETGVPRLPGSGAFFACRVARYENGGDHVVVLGDVLKAEAAHPHTAADAPLTYHRRTFGTHATLDTSAA